MARFNESIAVNVSVSEAYNLFSQFERFPGFMDGVEEVRRTGPDRLLWRAEIGGREEEWEAKITKEQPDTAIAWQSIAGSRNAGEVTFDKVDKDTTRVNLHVEYEPEGFVENVGALLGVVNGRMKADLKRFKELVESGRHETGWHDPAERSQAAAERDRAVGEARRSAHRDDVGYDRREVDREEAHDRHQVGHEVGREVGNDRHDSGQREAAGGAAAAGAAAAGGRIGRTVEAAGQFIDRNLDKAGDYIDRNVDRAGNVIDRVDKAGDVIGRKVDGAGQFIDRNVDRANDALGRGSKAADAADATAGGAGGAADARAPGGLDAGATTREGGERTTRAANRTSDRLSDMANRGAERTRDRLDSDADGGVPAHRDNAAKDVAKADDLDRTDDADPLARKGGRDA